MKINKIQNVIEFEFTTNEDEITYNCKVVGNNAVISWVADGVSHYTKHFILKICDYIRYDEWKITKLITTGFEQPVNFHQVLS